VTPGNNDERRCLRIHISGRVQGVCFRHYASMEANRLGIAGWVRNTPDGSVEALICGNAKQLAAMKKWLSHGPEMARVDALRMHHANLERFPGAFRIRLSR